MASETVQTEMMSMSTAVSILSIHECNELLLINCCSLFFQVLQRAVRCSLHVLTVWFRVFRSVGDAMASLTAWTSLTNVIVSQNIRQVGKTLEVFLRTCYFRSIDVVFLSSVPLPMHWRGEVYWVWSTVWLDRRLWLRSGRTPFVLWAITSSYALKNTGYPILKELSRSSYCIVLFM